MEMLQKPEKSRLQGHRKKIHLPLSSVENIERVSQKRNNSISDFRKCPRLSSDNLDERQKWVGKSEAITGVQTGEGGDVELVSELLEKVEI